MTDRISALTVMLDRDIRSDDVEVLMDAIRMLRYVGSVEKHVATGEEQMARGRVAMKIGSKLHDAISAIVRDDKPLPEDWKRFSKE